MGDQQNQPLFTAKAHVFQIDPETKKAWLPVGQQSLNVSFYHDVSRNAYRIISMDGSKVAINSTLSSSMSFAKTSLKFGQWADPRAGTVYGLGFANEGDLSKFVDKFNEMKELAARDQQQPLQQPQQQQPQQQPQQLQQQLQQQPKNGSADSEFKVFEELKRENEELKKSLLESKNNARLWDGELQTLRNNNARLTAALQESSVNLDQWRKQLEAYKDECTTLRAKISEQERSKGESAKIQFQLSEVKEKLREVETTAQQKQEELILVTKKYEETRQMESKYERLNSTLQLAEEEGKKLRAQVSELQQQLSQTTRPSNKQQLEKLQQQLSAKINEIYEMNDRLADLLQPTS